MQRLRVREDNNASLTCRDAIVFLPCIRFRLFCANCEPASSKTKVEKIEEGKACFGLAGHLGCKLKDGPCSLGLGHCGALAS